ncbi:MAG TPA: tetratricopeptide repeat protein [Oligoflexus sp.]|uniref:tetratricopeptide repeat protein n=1 Tax=Oligoflexus sp. TaxID=1971216 RepID=UPI002D2458A8|nr:tetratricopeptide repeat protein [Oligoflexus sp.]HYX36432.1 tetratricopeptide repeat protein [Oligoflexus sp.]
MATARAFDFTGKDQNAPVKDLFVKAATVFISRTTVRSVVVREMKNYGILTINVFDSIAECCEDLQKNPDSMLVVDWEHGEQTVTKVLRAAQGPYRVDTRPIYFIALDLAERVISVANEFNVMQIHTGEISQAQIVKNLNELLKFATVTPACRKAFRDVAALRKKGDGEATESILRKLCEDEPNNVRAGVELGATLFDLGRYDDALEWMQKVHASSDGDLRAQHLLARCLMKMGSFEEAQKLLDEAWLISPHNVDRLVDLGNILLSLDKTTEALGKFNDALKLDKDFKEAKIGKAQCSMLEGHVNEAMKFLGQIDTPKELASIFNSAAIIAIRQGHFKQGLSLYKSAVTYVSSDTQVLARVFFNMGVGLVKWGKAAQALSAFEQAATLDAAFTKASHNVEILKAQKAKGGALTGTKRIQELESLEQEDEEFGAMDFGVNPTGTDKPAEAGAEDDEIDDSYFQSLVSGS